MYRSEFDPFGRKKPRPKLFAEVKESPISVAIQLFLIFLLVRFTMIVSGIFLIRIPVIDDYLVKLVFLIPLPH